ncbi:MAG: hypothetical protein H7X92_00855 [Chitinophagales bacterium]|nr:hypothetical protein [Hyphomicrobiales bacterium]
MLIGKLDCKTLYGCVERVRLDLNPLAYLDGFPAFYDLADTENRLLVRLLEKESVTGERAQIKRTVIYVQISPHWRTL